MIAFNRGTTAVLDGTVTQPGIRWALQQGTGFYRTAISGFSSVGFASSGVFAGMFSLNAWFPPGIKLATSLAEVTNLSSSPPFGGIVGSESNTLQLCAFGDGVTARAIFLSTLTSNAATAITSLGVRVWIHAGAAVGSGIIELRDPVTLGASGSYLGQLLFSGSTSGTVTMQSAAVAGTWTLTLPIDDGTNGQALTTDGNGITTWTTVTTAPGGANTNVQYNDAGAFGGSAAFTFTKASGLVTLSGVALAGGAGLLQLFGATHTAVVSEVFPVYVDTGTLTVTGGYASQRFSYFLQPTLTAATAQTVVTTSTLEIQGAPRGLASMVVTNTYGLNFAGASVTIANAAGSTYRALRMGAHTITLSTATQITSTVFAAALDLGIITINQSGGAVTVDNAATLYVAGAPAAGAGVTITNRYAFLLGGGNIRSVAAVDWVAVSNTASAWRLTDGTNTYYSLDTRTNGQNIHTLSAPNNTVAQTVLYLSTYTLTYGGTVAGSVGLIAAFSNPVIASSAGAIVITTVNQVTFSGTVKSSANVTLTNASAVYFSAGTSAAGTITNNAYIYMEALTEGTNRYSLSLADTILWRGAGAANAFLPATDNTGQLGNGTYRWQLIRGVTITSGDLRFENDWYFTEANRVGRGDGIALCRPDGSVAQVFA